MKLVVTGFEKRERLFYASFVTIVPFIVYYYGNVY